jgi:hypothetical protein
MTLTLIGCYTIITINKRELKARDAAMAISNPTKAARIGKLGS